MVPVTFAYLALHFVRALRHLHVHVHGQNMFLSRAFMGRAQWTVILFSKLLVRMEDSLNLLFHPSSFNSYLASHADFLRLVTLSSPRMCDKP